MENPDFELKEVNGDLFTAPSDYSLGHCVAADLRMGKGIAIVFKNKFGQLDTLKTQKVTTGGVAVLQDNKRFIYYLITKPTTYQKPSYRDLYRSLEATRDHMRKNGVRKLAIPRIGCGLDGKLWPKVKAQIIEVFNKESVQIVVYNFGRK